MAIAIPAVVVAAEAVYDAILLVGSAMALGVGIAETQDEINKTFGDKEAAKVEECPAPPGEPPECETLQTQIRAVLNELKQRYAEMREDKYGLYPIRPARIPGVGSWPGHVQQFEDKQSQLRKLLNQSDTLGCKPQNPDARWWSSVEPPRQPEP
jgi:hypothetical protein